MKKINNFMPLMTFLIAFTVTTVFFIEFLEFPIDQLIIVAVFGIIITTSLVSTVRLFFKLYRKNKSINEAINHLEDFNYKDFNKDIHKNFSKLKVFFKKKSEIITAWKQYQKTIRIISTNNVGESKKRYYTTIDADYFFNEEFLTSNLNSKLYNYIPQLLIALGIFGTFLGLVLGLQGLNIGTAAETQSSIEILIDGVSLSFLTSLYGIAYSILITFFQKYLIGNGVTKIDKLADELNALFEKNTQEDGVKELYIELEKQTASLECMATDFAEKVDEKFNSTIQNNLGPVLEKLGESTERLANMSENTNQDAIQKLVENTGEIVSKATQEEMEKLTDSLTDITNKNEILFNKFATSISQIDNMIQSQQDIIEQTNHSAVNVGKTNNDIQNLNSELNQTTSRLIEFSKNQEISLGDYNELMIGIKEYMKQQNESNRLIAATLEGSYKNAEMQQNVNLQLNETSNNLRGFLQEFKPILSNMESNMTLFEEMSEEINDKFVNSLGKLEKYHNNINNSISLVSEELDSTVIKLKDDVFDNLTSISGKYGSIAEYLGKFSQESSEIMEGLNKFNQTQKGSEKLWSTYQDSFDNLNLEIKDGIKDYTGNIRSGVNNILHDYDSHIESVLGKFNESIDQFTDSIEELNDTLSNLEKYKGRR